MTGLWCSSSHTGQSLNLALPNSPSGLLSPVTMTLAPSHSPNPHLSTRLCPASTFPTLTPVTHPWSLALSCSTQTNPSPPPPRSLSDNLAPHTTCSSVHSITLLSPLAPILPSLWGYLDSDYANCPNTSRSISGYCFTLGSGAISWMFKKQRIMADSLCYTKYIALHDTSHKVAFLCMLLTGLSFSPSSLTPIHCNNDAAHTLAEDHIGHPNVKHICVKFHHIRQLMEDGSVSLLRMQSADNMADILTKPLAQGNFQCLPSVFIPHLDGTPISCEEEHFPCPGHLHIYPLLTSLTHYIHDS